MKPRSVYDRYLVRVLEKLRDRCGNADVLATELNRHDAATSGDRIRRILKGTPVRLCELAALSKASGRTIDELIGVAKEQKINGVLFSDAVNFLNSFHFGSDVDSESEAAA